MRDVMMLLALVALAVPAQAERVTVTVSWLEQDVYHAEHPTSDVYLFTEGCMEVVQKETVVLDMEPGPPGVVRLLFHGGEVECRVVKAMADGQVTEEKRHAADAPTSSALEGRVRLEAKTATRPYRREGNPASAGPSSRGGFPAHEPLPR